MKVLKIDYPTALSSIKDIENDNIDVFVELEDGNIYTIVVTTYQNILWYMEKEKVNFLYPSPQIIVRSLTEKNIMEALEYFCKDDAYWLKVYHLAESFRIGDLDKMIDEQKKERNEIFNR